MSQVAQQASLDMPSATVRISPEWNAVMRRAALQARGGPRWLKRLLHLRENRARLTSEITSPR